MVGLLIVGLPSGTLYAGDNTHIPGIHAMGNGGMCVYGRQSDVLQVFGAPYSSPSFMEMKLVPLSHGAWRCSSSRVPQTATWHHRLTDPEDSVVEMTDFVTAPGVNALVRSFSAARQVEYRLNIGLEARYAPQDTALHVERIAKGESVEVQIAAGVPFYSRYVAPCGYRYRIVATGSARLVVDSVRRLRVTVERGKAALYVVDCGERGGMGALQRVMESPVDALRRQSEEQWLRYSEAVRLENGAMNGAQRDMLSRAADDVAVLIRSQQDVSGGVLAGIVYHMGYVRDQYGVSRALLAMGHHREARRILDFYFNIWGRYGYIKNAQALGYQGIFHCHENDCSEITGYLVVQAIDYLRATGDSAYIEKILPMLNWAVEAQRGELIDGMMPFNGDETYIAGGLIPRQVMYHGSAEATLLFIEGTERLLHFVEARSLWPQQQVVAVRRDVKKCSSRYRHNFYVGGAFYLNQPSREKKAHYPEERAGVCLYPGHLDHFPVTYHAKGCLYYCADCMKRDTAGIALPPVERYSIPSSFLFPIYIDAKLLSDKEKQALLDRVIDRYRSTGRISSDDRILGYDYGMFLFGLVRYDNPLATTIYRQMMALRDGAGAWVEYYVDGRPNGCGCRPWESGINIEAAIRYAMSPLSSSAE